MIAYKKRAVFTALFLHSGGDEGVEPLSEGTSSRTSPGAVI